MSGTVSASDIVELRKLIMGTYSSLPFSNSWRFVDKNLENAILGSMDPFKELDPLADPALPNSHGTEYPFIPPPNRFCTGEFAPFTLPSTLPYGGVYWI